MFQNKCEKYWPDVGENKEFDGISVKNVDQDVQAHFTLRKLFVSKVGAAAKSVLS